VDQPPSATPAQEFQAVANALSCRRSSFGE
jgi:hypothetical protein